MEQYRFLRHFDSRVHDGLNGLNPLSTLSGLGLQLPIPIDARGKGKIAREEAALETKLVEKIHSGDWESLKPNSGKTISLGEHQISVGFRDDTDSGYRIWEWHGHILIFDDEGGYSPEYIYGSHFQSLDKELHNEDDDDDNDFNGHIDMDDEVNQFSYFDENVDLYRYIDEDDDVNQQALCDGIVVLGLGSSIIPLGERNQQQQQLLLSHVRGRLQQERHDAI
ncbi:hypothetical protein GOP47_0011978 [Adiantum capillus-veneris]|uniref:Uncharacterized protein n=1 Tax=Adiantum capillus-veneris TaxID=13818 RepID=A0A9D4UTS2_ADICA|nr:hypothetical protein GOP47_0011978 [Adiantum capillus-veneris]